MARERKAHMDGREFRFVVGGYTVTITDPHGRRFIVRVSELKGIPEAAVERGRGKGTSDGMVTPSDVVRHLERTWTPLTTG